ncbi:hypothetical protein GOB93_14530 [Acetobacter musti]|uniref:Hedgehog/Intein (Hint) domain-containing protein n=1 Tax=Acetobacter musti TaxID=864732 RepID=A0ABX0JV24_9PROT|nr:Hint domain-containing protein [Acetobacter musti]NHN85848.1 hypothetical protein [Acetobacter musti]
MTSASSDVTTPATSGAWIVSGQTALVSAGETITGATVVGGGTLLVSGTASDTTLLGTSAGPATEIIAAGGTENSVQVTSGTVSATSGATISEATVLKGGTLVLSSGASAGTLIAGTGGNITISAAQTSSLILEGGSVSITSAAVPLSAFSGGTLLLGNGTSAAGLTVGSGGTLQLNGGAATGTVISGPSASEQILAAPAAGGPADTQFDIISGGTQTVFFGIGVASGTVDAGGTQILMSSATANQVTIASGGQQSLSAGAVATDDTIETGASVINNGTLVFGGQSTIQGEISGAGLIEQTGPHDTVRFASGALAAFSGTIDIGGGTVIVANGQDAANISFGFTASGPETLVLGGSLPAALTVSGFASGDSIVLSGLTSGATFDISSGSQLRIESGGTLIETISLGSGLDYGSAGLTLTEQPDGSAAILTLGGAPSGYTNIVISPGATSTQVSAGDGAVISAGTTAIQTEILDGGRLYIDGTGIQNIVDGGGSETISAGGTAIQTAVASGGTTTVLSGGTASGTLVNGGTQDIEGGTVTSATIRGTVITDASTSYFPTPFTGSQIVDSGGVASSTLVTLATGYESPWNNPVYAGATQYVENGGTAIDTTLSGAQTSWQMHMTTELTEGQVSQIVSSGGAAIHTTISTGGVMDVLSGGSASNVVLSGGGLTLETGALYSGTLTFAPLAANTPYASNITTGSVLTASMAMITSLTISGFDATGSVVNISPAMPTPTWVSTVSSIVISDLAFSATSPDTGLIGPDGTLTVTEGSETVSLHLSGTFGSEFYFQMAPDGGTEITYGVPCYCPGTLIATPDGERPVQDLAIGDLVLTASGKARPIRWIGRRSYDGRFARGNPDIMPVMIRPGALGDGLPRRTLTISPLHAMALDNTLVPARLLLNGTSIVQMQQTDHIDYIHIELETHDIILAEGAPSETFVDDGSRNMFHNAEEFGALYPDAPPARDTETSGRFCLPRIEDGPALEALRTRLAGIGQTLAAGYTVRGFTDIAGPATVEGWVRCDALPDEPRNLLIRCGGRDIGIVTADRFRADLTEGGRYSGRSGFTFPLPHPMPPELITVIDLETGAILPRAGQEEPQHAAA